VTCCHAKKEFFSLEFNRLDIVDRLKINCIEKKKSELCMYPQTIIVYLMEHFWSLMLLNPVLH
jgi:hypothetical protein